MPGFVIVKGPDGKPVGKRSADNKTPLPAGYTVEQESAPEPQAAAPVESTPLVGPDPSSKRKHQAGHKEEPSSADYFEQANPPKPVVDQSKAGLQAYRQSRGNARWFNIPGAGKGTEPPEDGDWWDQIKAAIPARLRDVTLIPSHGPVWQDPTDDEAEQALTTWKQGEGFTKPTPLQIEQYKDSKWDEELEAATNDERTVYRSSRITAQSPSFMKVAQALTQTFGKGEAYARGIDRSVTGGIVSAAIDEDGGDMFEFPTEKSKAASKRTTRRNKENAQRLMGDEAVFAGGGMLAGALIPAGVAGKTAAMADKALKAGQFAAGRGVIEGVARGAASAGVGTFGAELVAGEVDNAARADAGMSTKKQSEILRDAASSALIAAPLGGLLSAPAAVSRHLRKSGTPHAQALAELEEARGRTSFVSEVVPPPGSEQLADIQVAQKASSSTDVARDLASEKMVPSIEGEAAKARSGVEAVAGAESYGMTDNLLLDASRADDGLRKVATEAMERGRAIDTAAEDRTAQVANKVLGSLKRILPEQAAGGRFDKEAALRAEESAGVSALSMRPVVEKYQNIVKSMSWADGDAMPNTTVAKFKSAIDSITEKKVIAKDDLWLYGDAMVGEAKIVKGQDGTEMAEILLPREVGPRELDNFTRRMDEMANYEGGGGVDSERFKGIATEARKLGDEFKILRASNQRSHAEMLETESMLQATGLNKAPADAANVTEATSVFNNLKGMLGDRQLDSELALRRPVFEKWLAAKDPQLFGEYVELRKLKRQQAGANAFNITADGDSTGATLSSLVDTMKGSPDKFDAMVDSLGMGVDARAARQESLRVKDVFDSLGVPIKPEVGMAERAKLKGKLYEVLIKGGPEWEQLTAALKPEQRVALEPVRKAAKDADVMFQTLGFSPGKWSTAQRRDITDGVFKLLDTYRAKGAGKEFNTAVEEMYRSRPVLRDAIIRMRGEKAYQQLAQAAKENAGGVLSGGGVHGYIRGGFDFVNHRLDALMGAGQRGMIPGANRNDVASPLLRSPVGAPTEYSMAAAASSSREDETGKGGTFTMGRAGFDFLYNLAAQTSKVVTR